MTATTLSPADKLLKKQAYELFPAENTAVATYRALALEWHPDKNSDPRASEVFAHLTAKFSEAKRTWEHGDGYKNVLSIRKKSVLDAGEPWVMVYYPYIAAIPFELGELYVCPKAIIWAARREYDDLAHRWLDTIKSYKFPTPKHQEKLKACLPRNSHTVGYKDRSYTIIERDADVIRVADILSKRGPLEPAHVAWILSRAYHIAGFLQYSHIQHADITPESFFIEPDTHLGALLGGWYYTAQSGQELLASPTRTSHLLKSNHTLIDSQIRLMGRRLLGVTSPVQLRSRTDVAEPLKSWLLAPGTDHPAEASYQWRKTLEAAFGKRRFTELKLTTAEIYSV